MVRHQPLYSRAMEVPGVSLFRLSSETVTVQFLIKLYSCSDLAGADSARDNAGGLFFGELVVGCVNE